MHFGEPFGGLIPGSRGSVLGVLLRTGTPLTGRQIHGLLSDEHSLWSVQETLKTLTQLGIVETQTIGRAGVHTINEEHVAVPHLRALIDPIGALKRLLDDAIGEDVESVIIFGSVARGDARIDSDVDLAVISRDWNGGPDLEDLVRVRLGNNCDVLTFTPVEFRQLVGAGEPVVGDILRDGLALIGQMPWKAGVA